MSSTAYFATSLAPSHFLWWSWFPYPLSCFFLLVSSLWFHVRRPWYWTCSYLAFLIWNWYPCLARLAWLLILPHNLPRLPAKIFILSWLSNAHSVWHFSPTFVTLNSSWWTMPSFGTADSQTELHKVCGVSDSFKNSNDIQIHIDEKMAIH